MFSGGPSTGELLRTLLIELLYSQGSHISKTKMLEPQNLSSRTAENIARGIWQDHACILSYLGETGFNPQP